MEQTFDGRLGEHEQRDRVFEGHIEEVRRTIPARRLLVYRVTYGWEPLCASLKRAVPDAQSRTSIPPTSFEGAYSPANPGPRSIPARSGSPPPTRRRSRAARRRSNEGIHSTMQMSCASRVGLARISVGAITFP